MNRSKSHNKVDCEKFAIFQELGGEIEMLKNGPKLREEQKPAKIYFAFLSALCKNQNSRPL